MRKILTKMLAAFAVMIAFAATPAAAQATRTWVSGVGDDVNPCSRTAPCKTWAGAISKTAASGEINCLDDGAFGAVTITKSITLRCVGKEAGVLATLSSTGIVINIPGTAGRVTLHGLDIEGAGTGLIGVRVISAFDVLIEDCTIHGFGAVGGAGVKVGSSTTARVTISRSTLHTNETGVLNVATASSGHVKVYDSLVLDNTLGGLSVDGAGNDIEIIDNRITGVSGLIQTTGGVVRSFGGNVIQSGSVPAATGSTI